MQEPQDQSDSSSIKVGDIGNHKGILCQVVKKESGKYTIETPHGTQIQLGFLWIAQAWKPLNAREQEMYDGYVADAAAQKAKVEADFRRATK